MVRPKANGREAAGGFQSVESVASGQAPLMRVSAPGPASKQFLERLTRVVYGGLEFDDTPLVLRRKWGSTLEDLDGNLYIDMVTGWGSTNVGACHPEVVEAAITSLRDFGVECTVYLASEPVLGLAEKLVAITPSSLRRVAYEISGTESVESAIKFMRAATRRPFVLTFIGQYHGESYGARAVGSLASRGSRNMRHLMGGYVHVPFPHPYRCPFHREARTCDGVCVVDYIREFVLQHLVAPDEIAGVMIEPIAGEAGVLIPPDPFWPALLELCAEHGWLLCADEVQTGFGRTGRMFATEHWGLEPDLMCLAKGLSGGVMPIGATLGSVAAMPDDVVTGGTFPWQPAACAAALRGIEIIERDGLLGQAAHLERLAVETLGRLPDQFELVGDVRIKGLYIAVEFVFDRETKARAIDVARDVHLACIRRGLVNIYDSGKWFVRWQPALNMPESMFLRAVEILEESIAEVVKQKRVKP